MPSAVTSIAAAALAFAVIAPVGLGLAAGADADATQKSAVTYVCDLNGMDATLEAEVWVSKGFDGMWDWPWRDIPSYTEPAVVPESYPVVRFAGTLTSPEARYALHGLDDRAQFIDAQTGDAIDMRIAARSDDAVRFTYRNYPGDGLSCQAA